MNFTKRTEYALRALIEIGASDNESPVKREIIAKNQNISSQFLEQVLIPLTKASIIKSIRGPGGGFALSKSPDRINTWDVFSAVEKTTKLSDTGKSTKKDKDFSIVNKIQSVWKEIDTNLKETMENITLSDILKLETSNSSHSEFQSILNQYNPNNNRIFNIIDDDGKVVNKQWLGSANDDEILKAYKFMQYVRTADEMCMSYQRQGRLYTFPPNLGQEAISTSTGFVMKEEDWLVPSYREVAAWLLKGGSLRDIFLLWGGSEEGYLFSGAKNILPVSVPIASQLLHATGIGFALNYQKKRDAVFAFVGDGGTSEGDFHEALNFAGVWKAPVVFIIQNNQYAISVPISKQTSSKNLAIKSVAYGIPGLRVDGNDYFHLGKSTSALANNHIAGWQFDQVKLFHELSGAVAGSGKSIYIQNTHQGNASLAYGRGLSILDTNAAVLTGAYAIRVGQITDYNETTNVSTNTWAEGSYGFQISQKTSTANQFKDIFRVSTTSAENAVIAGWLFNDEYL